MKPSSVILIYNDKGADAICVRETYQSFIRTESNFQIQCVDAQYLNYSAWEKNTALIVMPGGRSLPYYQTLAHSGNQKIKNYVQEGGRYLGICAGAYYGCLQTEFEKGQPLEVIQKGVLNFFNGTACGPAYGTGEFDYDDYTGAKISEIAVKNLDANLHGESANQRKFYTYFKGGAKFILSREQKNVKVLASYSDIADTPPAIILCEFGEGVALLSGVHFEYSYQGINLQKDRGKFLYNELQKIEDERQLLFNKLIRELRIEDSGFRDLKKPF